MSRDLSEASHVDEERAHENIRRMGLDVSAKWTSQLIHDILSITSKLHMYH